MKVKCALRDLNAKVLWSESNHDINDAYLTIESTYPIAHSDAVCIWKGCVIIAVTKCLQPWEIYFIGLPEYLLKGYNQKFSRNS
jgi:hypothetical protein